MAGPLWPELISERLPAVAGPGVPVLPDWVFPTVSALLDVVADPELEVVLTAPDRPPLPELPGGATGMGLGLPASAEPVEPAIPEPAAGVAGIGGPAADS